MNSAVQPVRESVAAPGSSSLLDAALCDAEQATRERLPAALWERALSGPLAHIPPGKGT